MYRTLKALVGDGQVRAVELPGNTDRYERSGLHHHHHFHCTDCDRVFDVDRCPGNLERLAPTGFVAERHELVLYGKCKDCAAVRSSTVRHPRKRAATY